MINVLPNNKLLHTKLFKSNQIMFTSYSCIIQNQKNDREKYMTPKKNKTLITIITNGFVITSYIKIIFEVKSQREPTNDDI